MAKEYIKVKNLPKLNSNQITHTVGIDANGNPSLYEHTNNTNVGSSSNINLDLRVMNGNIQIRWIADDLSFLERNPKIFLYRYKKFKNNKNNKTIYKFVHPSDTSKYNTENMYYSGKQRIAKKIGGDEIYFDIERHTEFDLPEQGVWTTLNFNIYEYFTPDINYYYERTNPMSNEVVQVMVGDTEEQLDYFTQYINNYESLLQSPTKFFNFYSTPVNSIKKIGGGNNIRLCFKIVIDYNNLTKEKLPIAETKILKVNIYNIFDPQKPNITKLLGNRVSYKIL